MAIDIYIDGSCIGNPGPGGWAVILLDENGQHVVKDGTEKSTNNRMELTALIEALRFAKRLCHSDVRIHSDSEYVVKGTNERLPKWRRKAWRTPSGLLVKNADLWKQIGALIRSFDSVDFVWVKGHAGNVLNELADSYANSVAKEYTAS